jgi:FMN reductase
MLLGALPRLRVDLADHSADLFTWPHAGLAELNDAVSTSDYVVFASPTYKASYTGLLKAFLDRYPAGGLNGVVAFPVFTISSAGHALAVEFTLRPLLVELGASVPTGGLSFDMSEKGNMSAQLDRWVERNAAALGHYVPASAASVDPDLGRRQLPDHPRATVGSLRTGRSSKRR